MAAAAHAMRRAVKEGCCCQPDIEVLGWAESPSGDLSPVLHFAHNEWCPLPRSRDVGAARGAVTWVRPGENP